jgi:hypothetical protein
MQYDSSSKGVIQHRKTKKHIIIIIISRLSKLKKKLGGLFVNI